MWELAISERVLTVNVSESLYTPKCVERKVTAAERALTLAEVYAALEHLAVRERVVVRLAVFSGMRPGEIFALRRRHVATNGRVIEIEQRVYRGKIDTPKNGKRRTISVPDATAELLEDWLMSGVSPDPEAYVFSSGVGTPLWRDNVLERWIQKPLSAEGVGLGWVNFRAFRKTNASLGHAAGVDPKVAADQRGHGIGVAMDVYTATTIKQKSAATNKLERKFQIVKTPRPKKSA